MCCQSEVCDHFRAQLQLQLQPHREDMNDLVNAMAAFINLRFVKQQEQQSVILGCKQVNPETCAQAYKE